MFEIADWQDKYERKYKMVKGEPDKYSERVPINLILLTYNCDDYLEQCLKATANQVDNVYAMDNGSSDDTIKILKDNNIDYRKSSIKGDLSALMNLNLKRVPTNGWCFYVNPDEILFDLPKGFIGKYCRFLENNSIYASDVRFPDFIYNYGTLFAGFDWGEGPGFYWTARRLFRYTGIEQFRGETHYNISNLHPRQQNPIPNNEHTGMWGGVVTKTELVKLFHYGKCRGVERQRGKENRLINGEFIARGFVPTLPYHGPHPSVMGVM